MIRKEPLYIILQQKSHDHRENESIVKVAKEKYQLTCEGKPIRITLNISEETLKIQDEVE
jgi:hypothetical protein